MALSGMTGFSRVEGAWGPWSWAVEARSVNGRNLEVRFRAPAGFDGLEKTVRDLAQARLQRGQVNVGVQARRTDAVGRSQVNVAELERLLALAQPYVESGRAAAPRFDGLLAVRGVVETAVEEDTPELRAAVEAAMTRSLAAALDGLHASRLGEGTALLPVLAAQVDHIADLRRAAESEAADLPATLKARFARRIAELTEGVSEERIAQEAALLAVKADVREELDRLTAHVCAARELLLGAGAVGRRLDFLTQEFMREANTLCSKSASVALTAIGLELKATIEQFREQVQNVE